MAITTTDTKTGGRILYLTLGKDGVFYNKKEGIRVLSVSGTLTAVRIRESEYNGQKTHKVQMWLEDETDEQYPNLSVEFGLNSWFAWRALVRLAAIDLTKPFQFGTKTGEAKQGKNASIYAWISQDKNKVEADETLVPKPEIIEIDEFEKRTSYGKMRKWLEVKIQEWRTVLPKQVLALDGKQEPQADDAGEDDKEIRF